MIKFDNQFFYSAGFSLIFVSLAFATEVDNFTDRNKPLQDSARQVNNIVQNRLILTVENFNKEGTCLADIPLQNDKKFMQFLQYGMNRNWPQVYYDLKSMSESQLIPAHRPKNTSTRMSMDWVINVSGHRVGIDKIDHMLGHGFVYYERYLTNNQDLEDLIRIGHDREKGPWGLGGGGAESWGDKVANFQGYEFFKDLFENKKPTLKCVDGKVKILKRVDIARFVDHGMDESINCNNYTEHSHEIMINIEVGSGNKCPVELDKCEELVKKYGGLSSGLLHPGCLNQNREVSRTEIYQSPKNPKNTDGALDGFAIGNFLFNKKPNTELLKDSSIEESGEIEQAEVIEVSVPSPPIQEPSGEAQK